ncbi:hypothetical protein R1sor_015814 [Riccia sorocarpa]|uniref:U1 small nuclear ribonucleoprotein C n=1 Tax=Riccia sorocarpa TaxID=122646 RepID=A0ABD3HD98_9MARC
MPRYYCDYCDTYLTHDSPSVRTQHNAGYKHKANVRAYYQQFEEQQTQSLIDQKVKEHLGQAAAGGGTAFHQHLAALQAGQFKPPILGTAPGGLPSSQPPLLPIRPPVLPPPTSSSGYPSGGQYQYRPSPAGGAQPNGMPVPPTLTPPGAPPRQAGPSPNSGSYGSYNYGPNPGQQSRPVGPPSSASGYSAPQAQPGPPGSQNTYSYGPPGGQSASNNSYVPPPPGAPVGYRS